MENPNNRVFIIRHAQSTYNHAYHNLLTYRANPEKDFNLIDAPLSEDGILQCNNSVDAIRLTPNVKYVIMSPLRRCLQTAYLLYKDHPNFNEIQFVIEPDIREHLHSPCDIANPIEETLREFQPLFPKIDTSSLDGSNYWFINNLLPEDRDRILSRIEKSQENYKNVLMKEISDWHEQKNSK